MSKISARHLERKAFVYVRQSSLQQVSHHRESADRQYRLRERAQRLGWQADEEGVYDPNHYNDRLLLGLKGTLSDAELHFLKQRMIGTRRNKVRRGEFRIRLPVGYGWEEEEGI